MSLPYQYPHFFSQMLCSLSILEFVFKSASVFMLPSWQILLVIHLLASYWIFLWLGRLILVIYLLSSFGVVVIPQIPTECSDVISLAVCGVHLHGTPYIFLRSYNMCVYCTAFTYYS